MRQVDGWTTIRGLRCRGRQGTTAEERAHLGDYILDVAVRHDVGPAIETDDLAQALDISALASVAREAVAARPRALVEKIAGDVAESVLARFADVREVRVRVEKPEPDGLGAAAESVELTLRR
jgi:dihydroneopterin aldolase